MSVHTILLKAIENGVHDDRRLPQHPEPRFVRNENGGKERIFVDVI